MAIQPRELSDTETKETAASDAQAAANKAATTQKPIVEQMKSPAPEVKPGQNEGELAAAQTDTATTGAVTERLDRGAGGNQQLPNDPPRPAPEFVVAEVSDPPKDPVLHPAHTSATTRFNAPMDEIEARRDASEILPPGHPGVEAQRSGNPNRGNVPSAENFDPNDAAAIGNLPIIGDRADLRNVKDGDLFQARFLHNPNSDDMWAVKQMMPELMSNRIVRHGVPMAFWRDHAANRSPVARRVGNGYEVIG